MRRTAMMVLAVSLAGNAEMRWRSLPDLPEALGGQFAGVAGECLATAGGSYWDKPPWEKGTKFWADTVYVLERGAKAWRAAGKLPQPLAYGASAVAGDGMVLFGGQTPSGFSKAVLQLTLKDGAVRIRRLADLPGPLAMMSAAVTDTHVYLAGGQAESTPARALGAFLAIPLGDLLAGKAAWRELPSWNGPARLFAHAAACGEQVYLAGGSDLTPGAGGSPVRRFLRDAHRYTPGRGWEVLPAMPREAQAGVAACPDGLFHVFGGSDGTLSEELRDRHPGFRLDILAYDPRSRRWNEAGRLPVSLVTTGIARWGDEYVIPGGEDRPGHRSAKVVAARIERRTK